MKSLKWIPVIIFILGVLLFPLKVLAQSSKPPEEIDRERRAKARLEKARRKSKSTNTPTYSPSQNYYRRPRYRSYYGPAYTRVPPKPGNYEVRSYPSGAEVYMKGNLLGKTPLKMEKPPGAYPLTLRLPGYRELEIGLLFSSGSKRVITINLDRN